MEQRSFNGPSLTQAILNHACLNAKVLAEFCDAACESAHRKHAVVCPVSRLLEFRSPAAVELPLVLQAIFAMPTRVMSGLIWPAVDFHSRLACAHIRKERRKRIAPPHAHSSALGTVLVKGCGRRVETAVNGTAPSFVSETVRHSVSGVFRLRPLSLMTPARGCVTCDKTAMSHENRGATNAKSVAHPFHPTCARFHEALVGANENPSKGAPGETISSRHNVGHSMLCSVAGARRQPALAAIL